MFEKEAEEYLEELRQKKIPFDIYEVNNQLKLAFIAGLNKANEWHYVKEEGTPTKEGHYLVCLENKDHDIFDCWIYYDKDVGWYSMEVRMKDIYAWKEIVLPKIEGASI